jgi:hypothetical protein
MPVTKASKGVSGAVTSVFIAASQLLYLPSGCPETSNQKTLEAVVLNEVV